MKRNIPIIGQDGEVDTILIKQKVCDIQNFTNIGNLYRRAADAYQRLYEMDIESDEDDLHLYDNKTAQELEHDCIQNAAEYFENAADLSAELVSEDDK